MKIQELSEQLANQIAAGEVVERPASVVKELLENAIDAKSTQIEIKILEAGMKSITITDNGEGIAKADVITAFKRHATSKIHNQDDLFRIRTLGFRGEALPSIASVAKVTIKTAVDNEDSGTLLVLEGGKVVEHKASSKRTGTVIEVADLFFNTPARLKYIKSQATELSKITDIVQRLALSNPSISFSLFHNDKKLLETFGRGDLLATISGIYGDNQTRKMIEISAHNLDFKISGFISLPELHRKNRKFLTILVNGRYIKNYQLNHAIIAGYGTKLMVGVFPIAVVQIEMDPFLVDVNVHPTKQEVRLSKERELMGLITVAVREALAKEQLIPAALDNFKAKNVVFEKAEQLNLPLTAVKTPSVVKKVPNSNQYNNFLRNKNLVNEEQAIHAKPERLTYDRKSGEFSFNIAEEVTKFSVDNENEKKVACKNANFPHLEYFGQMHGTYLFAQNADGLYIIDQHAAHERIKFEEYREKLSQVSGDQQDLLVPIILEYSIDDVLKIKEKRTLLAQIGVILEDYGHNLFILRSVPTWIEKNNEEEIIRNLIEMLLDSGKIDLKKFREKAAATLGCKRAIKANQHLEVSQACTLIENLSKCENPFNCPHGRPILTHFTNKDLEKMFKRIQDTHEVRADLWE